MQSFLVLVLRFHKIWHLMVPKGNVTFESYKNSTILLQQQLNFSKESIKIRSLNPQTFKCEFASSSS